MSEYFFGCGRGTVGSRLQRRIQKIAEKHGADFIAVKMPGDGPRFWFSCPNRGNPFDQLTERAVIQELEATGVARLLWPEEAGGAY